MEFDSLHDYIRQIYGYTLDKEFVAVEAPSLTYLKLVRILSRTDVDTVDQSAVDLYKLALYNEKFTDINRARLAAVYFQLADLHEIIETIITKSGVKKNESFSDRQWGQDINS